MDMIKVMSVFGTRPEATKMAPLIKELEKYDDIESLVCVTAQHRQQLDQVLDIFRIKPDFDMDIMKQRQSLTDITSRVLYGFEEICAKVRPDIVLVHGDTTTSFAAGLSAFYQGIDVGHVEAGLRTYDKRQPFPEEMNRRLTGTIADLHFAPTATAREHLLLENVPEQNIYVTGNTTIDIFQYTVMDNYVFECDALNHIDYSKKIITMTAHRRENLGRPLEDICKAVRRLVEDFSDAEVVYAVHLNPAVRDTVYGILGGVPGVHLIDPIGVTDMHNLMSRSYMVMSDSGGIQEEAPHFDKPCLVLRNVTERPEGVETGALRLVGTDENIIYKNASELLRGEDYNEMAEAKNPFGDGFASQRIVGAIRHYYGHANERPLEFR